MSFTDLSIHFHNENGVAYCGKIIEEDDWDYMTNVMDDVTCKVCMKSPPIKAAIARGAINGRQA